MASARSEPKPETEERAERVAALHGESLLALVERRLAVREKPKPWREPAALLGFAGFLLATIQFLISTWSHHLDNALEERRQNNRNALDKSHFDQQKTWDKEKFEQESSERERQLVLDKFLGAKSAEERITVVGVLRRIANANDHRFNGMVASLEALLEADKARIADEKARIQTGVSTPNVKVDSSVQALAASEAAVDVALQQIRNIKAGDGAKPDEPMYYIQITQDADCNALKTNAAKIRGDFPNVAVLPQEGGLCALTIGRYPESEAKIKSQDWISSSAPTYVRAKKLVGGKASLVFGTHYKPTTP